MNDVGGIFLAEEAAISARNDVMCNVTAMLTLIACNPDQQIAQTLESLFSQTSPPDQLIIAIDDTVSFEQDAVIQHFLADKRIRTVELLRLQGTAGFASAMNAGLARCKGNWIMCLDGGDICHRDRLAIQLDYVARFPEVDVFSAWCEKITVKGKRIVACGVEHAAIVNALRWSNVLSHSSLLIRADLMREIGYSSNFSSLEDYEFVIRMMQDQARFRIIPAALITIRVKPRHLLSYLRFRFACWRSGFLTLRQYLVITLVTVVKQLANRPSDGKTEPVVRWVTQSTGQA